MKVGDYVRIHTLSGQGGIAKLEKIDDICITDKGAVDKNNIVKSGPNIIDVLEIGDYVNGHKIVSINNSATNPIHRFVIVNANKLDDNTQYSYQFKSIVTKEQFSQMEYKVGE